ncbi:hypothetical protein GO755_40465 [Spirosoma sp. HMF4905]|uniref:Phage integrase SAM-like domain-containing protein n=1 Tax=Spirosoma arboris TaxID=2682092 RepID=A0A7K1SRE0_9BACT|nr:hypothetical protein [Spirosoma arboris]MVM36347.1 hypothetical protein [Spirosoma arboris]
MNSLVFRHQPMKSPLFQFRKGRAKKKFHASTPDGKPDHDGTVCVVLTINNIRYGPYATDIYTFHQIWKARSQPRPSEAVIQLNEQMVNYANFLKEVYTALLHQCRIEGEVIPINGEMVMGAMTVERKRLKGETVAQLRALDIKQGSAYITLPELYKEFMIARKRDIEDNRQKRVDGQISRSTYDTYPKRWVMIEAYLKHTGRRDIPVVGIKAKWGEKLKDFLKTYRQKNGKLYQMVSINKSLSLMKMLMSFAKRQGHTDKMPLDELSCRSGSSAKPKPLTDAQMQHLETVYLPPNLRHICDSWLIAAELCLHYSDYKKLPKMTFITQPDGQRYIQHDRSKQRGTELLQTVDITPRAERLLAKYDIKKLYYKSSGDFADYLKIIAIRANLVDRDGNIIPLQFGQGRDTGLTSRVIRGANALQLTKMGGWANPRVANRYVGLDVEVVQGFARQHLSSIG